jgi:hypothetical protein
MLHAFINEICLLARPWKCKGEWCVWLHRFITWALDGAETVSLLLSAEALVEPLTSLCDMYWVSDTGTSFSPSASVFYIIIPFIRHRHTVWSYRLSVT